MIPSHFPPKNPIIIEKFPTFDTGIQNFKKNPMIYSILLAFALLFSGPIFSQNAESVVLKLILEEVPDRKNEVIGSIVVEDFKDIGGFQFSVNWDPTELEFIDLVKHPNVLGLKANENFNFLTANKGFFRTLWVDPSGGCLSLEKGKVLMAFRFTKKSETASFEIGDQPLSIEFFDCDYQSVNLRIKN